MLTQAQIDWICDRQNELIKFYEENIPLSDDKCLEITDWIAKTVEKAKGKKADCRNETRKALFDVVEVYAFVDPQYIACTKKYGYYEESFKRMMKRWSDEQKRWFEGASKDE